MARWRCQRATTWAAPCEPENSLAANLRGRQPVAIRQYFADRVREFIHASARNDDGVAAAVGFFGDAQKLSAIILAKFDVKIFALNLKLARLNDVIHLQSGRDSAPLTNERKAKFQLQAIYLQIAFAQCLRINSALAPCLFAILSLVRDGKIYLALECIDAHDENAQFVTDRKTAA